MIALHNGQHCLRDVGELDQSRWWALCLQWEQAHRSSWDILDVEDANQLVLGQAGRCVEEVQNLWNRNPLEKDKWIQIVLKTVTLLGGWMRFLLAWAGDRKRLFLEPVYSLKLGEWSGSKNGLMTSDRKFCFEKAICILPPVPTGMLFKCCTQRSTATESPICTMAVPSLVFKNLICKKKKG